MHISRSGSLEFEAPLDRVFPLFGPVREAEWADGWQPDVLYSQSPLAEEAGAIFLTEHPGEPQTIWIVNRFDPVQHAVEYWRITPGLRLAQVTVACQPTQSGGTQASVTYTFTALSEAGNQVLEAFTEDHYAAMMAHWQEAIAGCVSRQS
jgi:hypothetical protein